MEKKPNILDKSRVADPDDLAKDVLYDQHDVDLEKQAREDFPEPELSDAEADFEDFELDESTEDMISLDASDEVDDDVLEEEDTEINQIFEETNARELSYDPKKKDALSAYLNHTKRFDMLKADEEIQLAKAWRDNGDEKAKEKIVGAHLRLVAKIAQGYRGYSMPMLDLISEGHVGMMKALDKFDPDQGVRFSTYAMWWIKASMKEYVMRNWSLVKTGTTAAQKKLFFNLRTIRRKLLKEGQKYLTRDQIAYIAEEMNVPEKAVAEMAKRLNGHDYSLNTPIGGDNEGNWMDWLEDDSDNQETQVVQNDEFTKRFAMLEDAMEHLKPRELHIMQMRRLAEPPKTLEEIGLELNLSRERVRQIEIKAFTKLQKRVKETVRSQTSI